MRKKDIPKKCIDGERHSWKDHLYANKSTNKKAILIREYECNKCGCVYHVTTRFDIPALSNSLNKMYPKVRGQNE